MGFLFMLAALLLISSFCIRAAVSDPPPPSYLPSPACPSPSSPSCPLSPPLSSLPPNATILPQVLFNKSSLYLSTNLSSFSTLTLNFTEEFFTDCPPSLVFTLISQSPPPPPPPFITFNFSFPNSCADAEQSSLLALCEFQQPQSHKPTDFSCIASHSQSGESDHFNYAVMLTYDADSATVRVRMLVNYGGACEQNQTFIVITTLLQPYANDARTNRDDSIVLLVDYVASREATINITTMNDTSSSPAYEPNFSDPPPLHNSKSKHISFVVWVVLGVSILALLVGFTFLALSIKKQYYGRPPLISSRLPTGRRDTIPSSTTTRAPFPHHHLESQSSAAPMMGAFPLSPLYNIDNFQLTGTAGWLKQPNPR